MHTRTPLPQNWWWLLNEGAPRHLVEALTHYGVKEKTGKVDNYVILSWAQELDKLDVFTADTIPWCGLFLAYCMHNSGRDPPAQWWRAREWANWGSLCGGGPQLGDVLVFERESGGHVGLYVGEGKLKTGTKVFWVLGGNQGDQVSIAPIEQRRLWACRRPTYKIGKPVNVRRIEIQGNGTLSTNEA